MPVACERMAASMLTIVSRTLSNEPAMLFVVVVSPDNCADQFGRSVTKVSRIQALKCAGVRMAITQSALKMNHPTCRHDALPTRTCTAYPATKKVMMICITPAVIDRACAVALLTPCMRVELYPSNRNWNRCNGYRPAPAAAYLQYGR